MTGIPRAMHGRGTNPPRPNSGCSLPYTFGGLQRHWPGGILLVVAALLLSACSETPAPVPRPDTVILMPSEFQGIYLGMAKEEVDKKFTADGTRLTNEGLETVTRFVRDSIQVGLAFAFRDGHVSTATAWYDYTLVPHRITAERQNFLGFMMHRNEFDFQRCSFDIPGAPFVPDVGLVWEYPGYWVTATFAKPAEYFPDSMSFRPYFQFSIFDSLTTPADMWPNVVIPAADPEKQYFREVDSVVNIVRRLKNSRL